MSLLLTSSIIGAAVGAGLTALGAVGTSRYISKKNDEAEKARIDYEAEVLGRRVTPEDLKANSEQK